MTINQITIDPSLMQYLFLGMGIATLFVAFFVKHWVAYVVIGCLMVAALVSGIESGTPNTVLQIAEVVMLAVAAYKGWETANG